MPPGIGDAVLDLIRFVRNIEFIIVTTPSKLAFETVKKLASLLQELQVPVIGIVENMKHNPGDSIRTQTKKLNLPYLGEIPFDPAVEEAIGNPPALLNTAIAEEATKIATKIMRKN
jgi:ATP-binding protein involved in chromosome partitioning